jgi:hypothetical protein
MVLRAVPAESAANENITRSLTKERALATKTSIGGSVLLARLAAGFGGSIDAAVYWVRQIRGKIEHDGAGRPVVSLATADRALERFQKHAAESARLQSEYDRYLRERQQQLDTVVEEAFQRAGVAQLAREHQAMRDSTTHWVGLPLTISPAGRAIVQRATDEARERFEREHPLQTFEEFEKKRRKR